MSRILALGATLGLASCAHLKQDATDPVAPPVAESAPTTAMPTAATATVKTEKTGLKPKSEEPAVMLPVDDPGIRMPDMLNLPGEGEFRPAPSSSGTGSGAVISRPPTDPPSRVKPKTEASE